MAVAALGVSLVLLLGGISSVRHASGLDLLGGTLAACATVPLLAWRRAPFGVFVVTAAASTVATALDYSPVIPLGATAALYLLAASRDEANPWSPRTTAAAVALFVAYVSTTAAADRAFPGIELFHTGLAWSVAWFAGERARLRREQIAALKERIAGARREADGERRLAVAEERARIARDLHDSVAHAINVIAVRAGAARMGHEKDPERSRLALCAIEDIARQTVAEIDQLVGTLREGATANGNVDAPPGLASLDTLVAQHASAGLEVTIDTTGTPRPLGGTVDQAAYRILQEALTNAARHGAGPARIELAFGDRALELSVVNPVLAAAAARSSGGHGVIGMRERATRLGGSLHTQRFNGAFSVRAQLPYGAQRA
jgi:signal transduction histidine kinase